MDAGQDQAESSTSSNGESFVTITVDEPDVATRKTWLHSLKEEGVKEKPRREEMHKVPALFLAERNSICDFKPKLVSLGPYHWGNAELKRFQDRKSSMANRFLQDKKVEASLRREIRNNIPKLVAGYSQGSEIFYTNEWEEMLFLDGCFVLYFVFCVMYDQVEDLDMRDNQIDAVHHDLFLLGNQLPFKLLKILSGNDPELLHLLDKHIYTHSISKSVDWYGRQDEPTHLLDRLWTIITGGRSETQKWQWWQCWRKPPPIGIKSSVVWHARDLAAMGIYLKPNQSGCMKDIFFRSHLIYGTLCLPRVIFDDSTMPLLFNLAAYELCANVGSTITSWIFFIDSLVHHDEDIKDLQSAGVLVNHLATGYYDFYGINSMAQILRPMGTDTCMATKQKMDKFFKHKSQANLASWIAQGYQNNVKSPLTAILAAFLALCLAAIQTY